MARKHVPITADYPYHITARTVNREAFPINLGEAWDIYTEQLNFCRSAYSIDIFAFVMMTNHFHLLCKCQHPNLDKFMHHFMRETSRYINGAAGRINQLYGGNYYKSLIDSDKYFQAAYKYIYRNPIAARLTERAEDYKFSTLRSTIGVDPIKIPIHDELALNAGSLDKLLRWINTPYSPEHVKNIKDGLRRSKFSLVKDQITKRHPLEDLDLNFDLDI